MRLHECETASILAAAKQGMVSHSPTQSTNVAIQLIALWAVGRQQEARVSHGPEPPRSPASFESDYRWCPGDSGPAKRLDEANYQQLVGAGARSSLAPADHDLDNYRVSNNKHHYPGSDDDDHHHVDTHNHHDNDVHYSRSFP